MGGYTRVVYTAVITWYILHAEPVNALCAEPVNALCAEPVNALMRSLAMPLCGAWQFLYVRSLSNTSNPEPVKHF